MDHWAEVARRVGRTSELRTLFLACVCGLTVGCAGLHRSLEFTCPPCKGERPELREITPVPPLQPASWNDLPGWAEDDLTAAWPAFLRSCKAFRSRRDWIDWRSICESAESMKGPSAQAIRSFLESRLSPWVVTQPDGTRDGLITGYYEPILKGDREQTNFARYPVRSVPEDLLIIDLGDLYPELKGYRLRGQVEGRRVVPYASRAALREKEKQGLSARDGGAIAWVEDLVDLFFLHIQGSGQILLPDGNVIRVGYADQNGHPYKSAGRVLIDRGEINADQASMQGIQAWAKANPEKIEEVLNANPSYVFFRQLANNDDGPIGALGVPLEAGRSLAVDPRAIPLGVPVFLTTTQPLSSQPINRLMLAQDTGGAIKGVVRADFFWGLGAEAGAYAGRMKQKGRMWALLPNGRPVDKNVPAPTAPK